MVFIISILLLGYISTWILAYNFNLRRGLHLLQLEDYSPRRMLEVLQQRRGWFGSRLPMWIDLCFVAATLLFINSQSPKSIRFSFPSNILIILLIAGLIAVNLYSVRLLRKKLKEAKKPLVITARAKRILIVSGAFTILLMTILIISRLILLTKFFLYHPRAPEYQLNLLIALLHTTILHVVVIKYIAGLIPIAALHILRPYEWLTQRRYLKQAQAILQEMKPLVIGITGSYGKTGTKEILSALLAEKFNVFRPPGSYNTLMGVTRVVREGLRPYHEVFVVEMGAYRVGSITKLCELTRPQHGIITTIGVQHLERFKTQETIKRAKSELIKALPGGGIAVLNGDNQACREIGSEYGGEVIYFSVEGGGATPPYPLLPAGGELKRGVRLTDIVISLSGSDFNVHFPDGKATPLHLPLLGRAAISNAAAAIALADRLGVPRTALKAALTRLPQVCHRLELIRRSDGVIILDDAFNSNPIGAACALEVLSQAKTGRRILVTPGMVELGDLEAEANYQFGRQAALACDLALLVGLKRIEPIRQGLLKEGFNAAMIWTAPTLQEGLDRLQSYLKPGDVLLLENDLPDQYAGA
ncbi:MAG: UDP-N-acetylmuramoyl-tripeptide--D-alanyl-D-alanine ligase [Calditrichota bacterium]